MATTRRGSGSCDYTADDRAKKSQPIDWARGIVERDPVEMSRRRAVGSSSVSTKRYPMIGHMSSADTRGLRTTLERHLSAIPVRKHGKRMETPWRPATLILPLSKLPWPRIVAALQQTSSPRLRELRALLKRAKGQPKHAVDLVLFSLDCLAERPDQSDKALRPQLQEIWDDWRTRRHETRDKAD